VAPGGTLVLAGILSGQAAVVAEAYRDLAPLAVDAEREGWVRLVGSRPAPSGA
jgi:ribosomal protein L11 methylase PrmA